MLPVKGYQYRWPCRRFAAKGVLLQSTDFGPTCPLNLVLRNVDLTAKAATSEIVAPAAVPARSRGLAGALSELCKSRLSALVLCTTAVGFVAASGEAIQWSRFAVALFGTMLAAFGANALNQCVEVGRDARMNRTRNRPLVTGELTLGSGWAFGLVCAIAGPVVLWAGLNAVSGLLGLLCAGLYVLLYTPLKVVTPANTLVGAAVGAIPPMIGWCAVTGYPGWGAWVLAAILFVWQIPHFLALAWLYRDDYRRGGFRMLPCVDAGGQLTASIVLGYCLLLIPFTLLPTLGGLTGAAYSVSAVVLGLVFLGFGVQLGRSLTDLRARRLFLASIVYLPLLLAMMVIDRQAGPSGDSAAPELLVKPPADVTLAMVTDPSR